MTCPAIRQDEAMTREPSTTWGSAVAFAVVVFFAPLVVALVAVVALSPGEPYALWLLGTGGPMCLFGATWLAILTRRRARDVPGLALSSAAIGFGAAAVVALLLPIIGSFPEAGIAGVLYFGALTLVAAVGIYLAAGGPLWLAATALLASPLVLPGARASGRRVGIVLTILGCVLAVGCTAATWISAHHDSLEAACAALRPPSLDHAVPTGRFTWIPLGLNCEWPVGRSAYTTGPDWIATIAVVVGLSIAALGVALIIRSRAPRSVAA